MKQDVLLLDLGNSYLKYAFYDEKQLLGPVVSVPATMDKIAALLQSVTRGRSVSMVRLACVAGPEKQQQISDWCQDNGIQLQLATVQAQSDDLTIAYQQPQQLGVDRWLIMLALRHRSKRAFLAISCGTAVTLDRVEADGQHRGGLILPGLDLMLNTLQKHTAGICFDMNSVQDTIELGTDTGSCAYSGALHAITGMIEKQYRYASDQQQNAPDLFLTGGNAALVAAHLSLESTVIADLVLQGLAVLQQTGLPA